MKVGDKIVYIGNFELLQLNYGDVFTVCIVSDYSFVLNEGFRVFTKIEFEYYFISFLDFRKQKINKIRQRCLV